MPFETDTIELPAHWACALINGDITGIENDAEERRIAAIESNLANDGWHIVDVSEEPRFTWQYQLYDVGADCSGGDVLTYTIMRQV